MTLVSVEAQNASLAMSYGASRGSLAPDNLELALFNGDPTGDGTELSATGGYARVTIPNNASTWPDAPDGGQVTSVPIVFASSSAAWSDTADWWQLYDADTGDAWDAMPLSDPITVVSAGVVARPSLTVNYIPPNLGD